MDKSTKQIVITVVISTMANIGGQFLTNRYDILDYKIVDHEKRITKLEDRSIRK